MYGRFTRRALLAGGATAIATGGWLVADVRSVASPAYVCDVAVIGGGVGGVAAALAALRNGRRVILTEETTMLGGQFTSQLVPPDEHIWIEKSKGRLGQTWAYAELRGAVRAWYKRNRPMTAEFKKRAEPDPGAAWVGPLAAEPMVWRAHIGALLKPHLRSGQLQIFRRHRPVEARMRGSLVDSVTLRRPDGSRAEVRANYFVDATELGELLDVVDAPSVVGREANPKRPGQRKVPDPEDQQAFTWVAALGYDRTGDHRKPTPDGYVDLRPRFDEYFAKRLFDPTRDYSWSEGEPNYWQYRRVVARSQYAEPVEEVTLLNLACNDYTDGNLVGVTAAERDRHLKGARHLTACLIHYLQNDIPRKDGKGTGYPGLRLRPDIAGTPDGYALAPYIREARRLVSLGRVWEWHIGVEERPGSTTATQFDDSVGTGQYPMDVHAGPKDPYGRQRACYPYQIPLMALVSQQRPNVVAGGKALGVSHLAGGAYRVHPTEWSIGEAAGVVAHCCLAWGSNPVQVRDSSRDRKRLQDYLRGQGAQLDWPEDIRTKSR